MNYKVVVFGVKDATEGVVDYIQSKLCKVNLIITISPEVTKKNDIAGYKGLQPLKEIGRAHV